MSKQVSHEMVINATQTAFLENIRNDIRMPLIGIIHCANAIKENIGDPKKRKEVKEYAASVVTSSQALFDFLNEELEVSKMNPSEIPYLRKKFNLKDRLQHIIDLTKSIANQKHLSLIFSHDKKIPLFFIGDYTPIHRIVLELITNAINFTEEGQIKIGTQLLRLRGRLTTLKISVEDTGVGIPLDQQHNIFTRLTGIDPTSESMYKGAGLGLAITKQLIDTLGGQIYVDSELGRGSLFTCIFTLKRALFNEPPAEIPLLNEKETAGIPPLEAQEANESSTHPSHRENFSPNDLLTPDVSQNGGMPKAFPFAFNPLPDKVIDLELGARLLGGDPVLAKEMIHLLSKLLKKEKVVLKKYYDAQDWRGLEKLVEVLHEEIAYCGAPRLEIACKNLKSAFSHPCALIWWHRFYQHMVHEMELLQAEVENMVALPEQYR